MKINTARLRAMIGWLGMLLPWIVVLLTWGFPPSISATWYTNACTPFMIILGSASFLLISYKGYERIDDVILTCSGIAGLMICLFPCKNPWEDMEKVGTFMVDMNVSHIVHSVSAIIFFGLLAYWIVNTIRYKLKQKGYTSHWTEIVRVMKTQKAVTTEATNALGEKVHLRMCSEPNKAAENIYELLNYRKMPFRRIRIEKSL